MKSTALGVTALIASSLALGGCAQTAASTDPSSSSPITLMVMQSQTGVTGVDQTLPLGAEAAASSINDGGGIKGRQIQIITCDTASDPNKSTECARKAVSEKASAVVGSFDPIGITASLPVLQAAKIPYLGPIGTKAAEFSNPVSFPVTGGAPAAQFGMVAAALDTGCKKVGTFGDRVADFGQSDALVASFQAAGIEALVVNLPTKTGDVTPQVAQLLDWKPDCVAYGSSGQTAVQLFSAIRRAGSDAQFISAVSSLLPPFLKALGETAEGVVAVQDVPSLDSPELQAFRDDMEKYQPSVALSPFPLSGWYGVHAFAEVAGGVDNLSASSVLDALPKVSDLQLPALNKVSFTGSSDSKVYPRLFHPHVRYAVVKNGQYVPKDDSWHDISQYLP